MTNPLPDWLRLWFQSALISEIYPEIRAVALEFSEQCELRVRYYLDREPIDYDYESIAMVVGEVLSNTSCEKQIAKVKEECIFSDKKLVEIDRLDGIVYARREYKLYNKIIK